MSWNSDPKETRKEEFRSWQVVVGGYGNQSTQPNLLKVTCDTRDIYSVELLEIRYQPVVGEIGNLKLVNLRWKSGDLLNDDNKNYRTLAPNLLSDGSYIGEYNVARNLYKFNGLNHRPVSQSYDLELIKEVSGLPLNTDYVLCTLRFTAKHVAQGMNYQQRYEGTILNDRT